MIKGGYYIKARKIQNSLISVQPPHVREIWDWLLKEANHSESVYAGFVVKRGQLFRTYSDIREGLHWMIGWRKMTYNENQTKKAMKFLREAGMIDTKKELGGVLITICNYDYYQDQKNYERTTKDTEEGTIEEPMKNHPLPYNNKNEKEEKEEKGINKEPKENSSGEPKKKKSYKKVELSKITIDEFPEIDPQHLEIAKSFQSLFRENLKEKDISTTTVEAADGKWIDAVRLMMTKDKYKLDDFRDVFKFLRTNDFWKSNVSSVITLRKKFTMILSQARRPSGTKNSQADEMEAYKKKVFNDLTNG